MESTGSLVKEPTVQIVTDRGSYHSVQDSGDGKETQPRLSGMKGSILQAMSWHPFKRKPYDPISHRRRPWTPPALRWWNLVLAISICWCFIVVLQCLLSRSLRDGGIIFAPNINELPLRRSFAYLYLPTIVAVVFGIYWAWIDLDAKRFEPYYQLSKPDGALGKDSLLLHYPFDFIPLVPFLALRKRHWLVFWASAAMGLTAFGIVPLQAGIFSTKKVTLTYPQPYQLSHRFINASDQASGVGLSYLLSVSGILTLNASLPPFMTRNYTLAPFNMSGLLPQAGDTWTTNTSLYGVDLKCEVPQPRYEERNESIPIPGEVEMYPAPTKQLLGLFATYDSSTNCSYYLSPRRWNATIYTADDPPKFVPTKEYTTAYGQPWAEDSPFPEDYAPDMNCPRQDKLHRYETRPFFASFIQHRTEGSKEKNNFTVIYCEPFYYEQPVKATIDAVTKLPVHVTILDVKQPLPEKFIDYHAFTYGNMHVAQHTQPENGLPFFTPPSYLDPLIDTELDLGDKWDSMIAPDEIKPWAAMAIVAGNHKMKDYLKAEYLIESYEKAYRLAFANFMTEVLQTNFSSDTTQVSGQRTVRSEAVVLEPVFTYVVEGLLGFVSLSAIALLCIGIARRPRRKLLSDPGTIAAVMSLVADNASLLSEFEGLESGSTDYMQEELENRRFKLSDDGLQIQIAELGHRPSTELLNRLQPDDLTKPEEKIAKPIRPFEFRSFVAIPFIGLFVALLIALAILFAKNKAYGLPLPSKNRIVQNLVREYVPTVIATLIEPMWILINRILCMLQPLEELQRSRAHASKSIALNYNSLPPQLTIWKTFRSGHFVLTSVCAMALLANVLAAAFAGLLYQDDVHIQTPATLAHLFEPKFTNIIGSFGPSTKHTISLDKAEFSGAYRGEDGQDHFYVSESNYTQNTPFPPWTDGQSMYLPFSTSGMGNTGPIDASKRYQARTTFMSAKLDCKPLDPSVDYQLNYDAEAGIVRPLYANFTFKVPSDQGADTGGKTVCGARGGKNGLTSGYFSDSGTYRPLDLCHDGPYSGEYVTPLVAFPNATQAEQETCMSTAVVGWMRFSYPNCSVKSFMGQGNADNALFLACRPKITTGEATILVNSDGLLLEKATNRTSDSTVSDTAFSNGIANVLGQANLYMFRQLAFDMHNKPFATEPIHYFTNRAAGSTRLTDPSQPLPQYADIMEPLNKAYSRLFAIWLALNKERLLVPLPNNTAPSTSIPGHIISTEQRILFRTPLFILSEVILGIYVFASILIYLRRPGKYLPRMPTTIAAQIALFAASSAVEDLQGTSKFTAKEREKLLEEKNRRYGYGSYVGRDRSVHVGIERAPFVREREKTTFEYTKADRMRRKVRGTTEVP